MPKKFFDIIPPGEVKSFRKEMARPSRERASATAKAEEPLLGTVDAASGGPKAKIKPAKAARSKKFLLKGLVIVAVLLVLTVFSGYTFFARSEIKVWPAKDSIDLAETITIDTKASQPDFAAKIIPGKIVQDQRKKSQDFSATGTTTKEEKAKGAIRVFNAYSTASQTLVASTRFVSADGKLFRSTKKEVVPGGVYENGKLVPGSVDIEVQAAEPGEDYNIGPTTFSIPGFVGTPKYASFYGESSAPMAGGFKGAMGLVTSVDIDNAKRILSDEIKNESDEFLKKTVSGDLVLLNSTATFEVLQEKTSVAAGAAANSFNLQMEAKTTIFAFTKSDVDSFVRKKIASSIPEGKKFLEGSMGVNYSIDRKDADKVTVNLAINAKTYFAFDLEALKKSLLGKTPQEIKTFLKDQPQIEKIEIKTSPFWVKRIPENMEKVKVDLQLGS